MHTAAKIAKVGDRVLSFVALLLVLSMLLFGGYSLWDMWSTAHGAFISNDLLKYKPKEDDPDNLSLYDLKAINDDVRGWLTIDNSHIDYPVVQGSDDMEYVNKDIYGRFSLSGAIFLGYRNAPDFSDGYNLLYGHHVDGGAMFADVIEFQKADFFEKHRTGRLMTFGGNFRVDVFAVAALDAYDAYVYRDPSDYDDPADMQSLIDYLRTNSVQYRDIGVTGSDKVMALSTCTSSATYGRAVLFCKLTPES